MKKISPDVEDAEESTGKKKEKKCSINVHKKAYHKRL